MSDGKDCKCSAYGEHECGCGADWTPQEVYDLRAQVKSVTQERDLEIKRAREAEKRVKAIDTMLGEEIKMKEQAEKEIKLITDSWHRDIETNRIKIKDLTAQVKIEQDVAISLGEQLTEATARLEETEERLRKEEQACADFISDGNVLRRQLEEKQIIIDDLCDKWEEAKKEIERLKHEQS
jgi:hypothetical protein